MKDCCSDGTRLIYACSGAADVGELSDKAARKLRDKGYGKMVCLAAIGADLTGYIESAKGADENIVIDGCSTACGRKNFERIGVAHRSYVLTDMGYRKGETPPNEEIIASIAETIQEK